MRVVKSVAKLLCYELNEVPWRVVDYYIDLHPDSNLAKLLSRSAQFTTRTVDVGELHPWTTWPTIHRGVANDVHLIHSLNQDLSGAEKFPPIWELLVDSNKTCGVFGSLQSYPPVDNEKMSFHIPDTFAAGSETIPNRCAPFQAFNLMMTGENKAVASNVGVKQVPIAFGLLRSGIKPITYLKIAKHLFNEKRNPLYKKRRALLQPELAFDVFLSCLKKNQPDFVTFFSNHVAGVMHRYWKYTFPEDFEYELNGSGSDEFNRETLLVAMNMFDSHLGKLIKTSKRYGYDLVILSSMGQEAIERGEYVPETRLKSLQTLVEKLEVGFQVKQNLAMQPDVALEFSNPQELATFKSKVLNVMDSDGQSIFKERYAPVGNTANFQLRASRAAAKDKSVTYEGENFQITEFGLDLLERDIGTGYHQPDGILIWENFSAPPQDRETIDSRRVLPSMLKHFGIEPNNYMQSEIKSVQ